MSTLTAAAKDSLDNQIEQKDHGGFVVVSNHTHPHPIDRTLSQEMTLATWNSTLSMKQLRSMIFKGGINKSLRKLVWKYLLNFYARNMTLADRIALYQENQRLYDGWHKQAKDALLQNSPTAGEFHSRILRDVLRTDVDLPFYKSTSPTTTSKNNPKEHLHPNSQKLLDILFTYAFAYPDNKNGFVQGMADLCSVFLVVFEGDVVYTFWCFVSFMEKMSPNFSEDGVQIQQHLTSTSQILETYLPELYHHLNKIDASKMFQCYRWFLILFKREFTIDDISKLWEVIWCSSGSDGWWKFTYVIAICILEQHVDKLLQMQDFDEMLHFINGLSMSIRVDEILDRAQLLYLPIQSMAWSDDADDGDIIL